MRFDVLVSILHASLPFELLVRLAEIFHCSHDDDVYFRQHDFHLPHNDGGDDGRSPLQDSPIHEHDIQDARRRHRHNLSSWPEGILFNRTIPQDLLEKQTVFLFNVQLDSKTFDTPELSNVRELSGNY